MVLTSTFLPAEKSNLNQPPRPSRTVSRTSSQENINEVHEPENDKVTSEVVKEETLYQDLIFDTHKVDLGEVEIDKDVQGSFMVQNMSDSEALIMIFEKLELENEDAQDGSMVIQKEKRKKKKKEKEVEKEKKIIKYPLKGI